MGDDKKICYSYDRSIHRLIQKMPSLFQEYGLWIINGSIDCCSKANSYYDIKERIFEFYSISHLIEGGGKLWLEKTGEQKLSIGDAVIITPGTSNRYGGADNLPYVEDSIRFCGRIPDTLNRAGLINSGVIRLGMMRRIRPIIELAQDPSRKSWLKANLLLQELLLELFDNSGSPEPDPLETLLTTLRSAPINRWWTVEELAELLGISTDQLRRNFLKRTGLLPKAYLEQLKLSQAAKMIVSGQWRLRQISAAVGYSDYYHFSRRFKHYHGIAPEQYRKLFDNNALTSSKSSL